MVVAGAGEAGPRVVDATGLRPVWPELAQAEKLRVRRAALDAGPARAPEIVERHLQRLTGEQCRRSWPGAGGPGLGPAQQVARQRENIGRRRHVRRWSQRASFSDSCTRFTVSPSKNR